ncbi:hypothetical protein JHK86_001052 [Glycine max]|nr:hypothetical protein JHK86_001052 [Glycine max]
MKKEEEMLSQLMTRKAYGSLRCNTSISISETHGSIFTANGMGNGGSSKEPPNSGGGGKRRVSFKDLMIGNKAPVALRQKVDLIQQNW